MVSLTKALLFAAVWLLAFRCSCEAALRCPAAVYGGYDTRLSGRLMVRLPEERGVLGSFELLNGRPVVAVGSTLFVLRGDGSWDAIRGNKTISEVAIPGQTILARVGTGLQRLTGDELREDKGISSLQGHIAGSGRDSFVEAVVGGGDVTFFARKVTGDGVPIGKFRGVLVATSWDALGFAAVVGTSLLVWEPGADRIEVIAQDDALRRARDLTLVGRRRVVVSLDAGLVLVTPETVTTILLHHARARWSAGHLIVADEARNEIWDISGLEKVGGAKGDRDRARELAQASRGDEIGTSKRFLEAVRLVGCDAALPWRGRPQ